MNSIIEARHSILLVSSIRHEFFLKKMLGEHALRGWQTSPHIRLLTLPGHLFRDPGYVKGQIKKYAKENGPDIYFDVFVFGIEISNILLADRDDLDRWEIRHCGNVPKTFEEKIKKGLRALRLDWFSEITDALNNAWLRAEINEEHVRDWVGQFSALGKYDWIGKKLLQSLDFWPESKVIDALSITPGNLKGFDHLCLFTDKAGKSADILRNLVSKRLESFGQGDPNPTIHNPQSCIDTPLQNNILWIEDCLLTATEVSSLINSLLGKIPEGRPPKTNPLNNPDNLKKKYIQFRFAIATDFGFKILNNVLEDNEINHCEIAYKEFLEVLTSEGIDAITNNKFFVDKSHKLIRDPLVFLKMPAFSKNTIWNKNADRKKAIDFCKKVGMQLYKNYISRQVQHNGWTPWPQRRINQCALGMNGFGLSLALAHTIPKASLPLFWGRGNVSIKTRNSKWEVDWIPLFPGTD